LSVTATAAQSRPDVLDGADFVDSLVARLHAEYGVDRDELRRLAAAALETFASARVQTFVPILVEKSLRDACRRHRAARQGADDGQGRWTAGRSR
jgi:hypothetical protein